MMTALIGWVMLSFVSVILVAQIISYVSAKRVFTKLEEDAGNAALTSEAEAARGTGPRARLKWLKLKYPDLTGRAQSLAKLAIRFDLVCNVLFVIMIIVWIIAAIRG